MADADQMTDMAGLVDAGDLDALTDKMKAPPQAAPEPVGGGTDGWIEPIAKWRDLTQFVVPYTDTSNPWKEVERQRPMFVDAMEKAGQWFGERGGPIPMTIADDAIEVRLYPYTRLPDGRRAPQLWFFVKGMIRDSASGLLVAGETGISYMLSREQVGFLKSTNRWPLKRPVGESVH